MDILIAGVGGQGTVTLGDLIAERAAEQGLPVSIFHSRGMAHRGGRVSGELRIASRPGQRLGPRISPDGADVLVGMEIGEAINSLPFLKPGGVALLLDYRYLPSETAVKKLAYPDLEQARALFSGKAGSLHAVAGPRAPLNLFALGYLAAVLSPGLDPQGVFAPKALEKIIRARLRKNTEENLLAFRQGYELGRSG
jgi:indolepyruvate ferredoxin oxidoreductase beta subunit